MRKLLRLGTSHRLRTTLLTAGLAAAVLLVAFAGGVVKGRTEHTTTYHGTGSLPPVVSTTTSIPAPAITAIKLQLVEDMSLDVESQRLEADLNRRAALAETPAAVAARHDAISTAWAPDKAPLVQLQYDRAVVANAHNRRSPSVLHAAFVVISWGAISVDGDLATVTLRGHYQLTETATVVNLTDQTWTIVLRLDGGRWRLENRGAA